MGRCADLVVPLEVGRDGELHLQRGAGDGLQVDGQVQLGKLVHVLVDGLPHFGHPDELAWGEGAWLERCARRHSACGSGREQTYRSRCG